MENIVYSGSERRLTWHTASGAAQLTGLGRRSLDRVAELGVIPYRVLNGQRLFEQEALLAFRAKLIRIALDDGLVVRKEDVK